MIKNLSIQNFGSNEKLDLKLDRHITCITGESYTGKSWALRALKWVVQNKPAGIRYITWDSKKASVTIKMGCHKIKRERSKIINSYYIDKTKLQAFGNNVPDSVAKMINMSSLNFQIQQELPHGDGPLFWFALTPGQVSKRLNEIVNLDLIDRILYNLQSESRTAKTTLDVCKERRKEAKEQVEKLAFVEQMKKEWRAISVLIEQTEENEKETTRVKETIDNIEKQQNIVDDMKQHMNKIENDLEELENLNQQIINTENKAQQLEDILIAVENGIQDLKQNRKELRIAKQEYKKISIVRCPKCKTKIEL